MKLRILCCSEASYLATGYSVYTREVLSRLHATGLYEIAEQACYAAHTDERLTSIPWKVYPNLPDPSNKEQVDFYNSNPINNFGAWKFEEIVLDFRPHIVCVPGESLVFTNNGYQRIDTIQIGDIVKTHTGNSNKVRRLFKNKHKGYIYKIYSRGSDIPLVVTPEHPVFIYKNKKQTNRLKSIHKIQNDNNGEFVPAQDIKVGDFVFFPKIKYYHTNYIHLPCTLKNIHKYKDYYSSNYGDYKCPNKIELSKDFGKLLGYIIRDGYIHKNSISLTFNIKEQAFVKDVENIIKKLFNLKVKIHQQSGKNWYTVYINNNIVTNIIQNMIGTLKNKNIPEFTWKAPNKFKEGLIEGLVKSYGAYKKNTVSFASINNKLRHNFRALCFSLDIKTHISGYEVSGFGENTTKLHNISHKYEEVQDNNKYQLRSSKRIHKIDKGYLSKIYKIEIEEYDDYVYNIEVENDNSYIVNDVAVHNCDIRDIWMMSHELTSPFRNLYHLAWMPTVDAYPQAKEWIASFSDVDSILTYSYFAKDVLESQSGGKIKVFGVPSPAADLKLYPINKLENKAKYGLENYKIVGTVMRNQRRKLYPALFKVFRKFLDISQRKDVLLYCHTSYPDLSPWDIPELINDYGLGNYIIMTYKCRNCKIVFPHRFADHGFVCPRCSSFSVMNSTVQEGVNTDEMREIYNLFDLYIQYSNSEGWCLPITEAASCGVPVMAVDYSAMEDNTRKVEGLPLKVAGFYKEMETGCNRAVPDDDFATDELVKFFNLSDEQQLKFGNNCRMSYLKNYSYDKSASIWQNLFNSLSVEELEKRWLSNPRIHPIASYNPREELNNTEYIEWLITDVLCEPERLGSFFHLKLIKDLNYGCSTNAGGIMYSIENSMFHNNKRQEFKREEAYKHISYLANYRNHWENIRSERLR